MILVRKVFRCVFYLVLATMMSPLVAQGVDVTYIILGASGDLTRRDLIPALYSLFKDGKINNFALIGAALPALTAGDILTSSRPFINDYDETSWKSFAEKIHYVSIDFMREQDYAVLKEKIVAVEKHLKLPGNRLVYCATSCNFFRTITENLLQVGILEKKDESAHGPWYRIVYEKPLGYDLKTACAIKECAQKMLHEKQIFCMDHFLMTQALSHVLSLRFINKIFESQWNCHHIQQVDILFNETLSVGTRGKFYDAVGAMLDVVQNHMLQMLTLVAMEPPYDLTYDSIRNAKVDVLRNIHLEDGFFGQYHGYRQAVDVPSNSSTDTYVALKLKVNTPRWEQVPFYMITGKCVDQTEICIRVTFQPVDGNSSNILTIWVAPEPGYELKLGMRRVLIDQQETPVTLKYTYPRANSYSTETYKLIFDQLVHGNHAVSVGFDEIEAAWQLTDQIKTCGLPLYFYEQGSAGPIELKILCETNTKIQG
jgi:glucose-6-phosphate 1-dehydrogenase